MATHVALLRGINVGGRKLLMADLRAIVEALGHADVATYIQSGNVLFTAPPDVADEVLAGAIEAGIEERLAMRVGVVVLTRAELAGALAADPYRAEPNPKFVHLIFHAEPPDQAAHDRLAAAQAEAAGKGSRDEGTIVGRTLYLHTPDGFGRSELAAALTRASRRAPLGTARNRATATKLLDLLGPG